MIPFFVFFTQAWMFGKCITRESQLMLPNLDSQTKPQWIIPKENFSVISHSGGSNLLPENFQVVALVVVMVLASAVALRANVFTTV